MSMLVLFSGRALDEWAQWRSRTLCGSSPSVCVLVVEMGIRMALNDGPR